jgi:hypothetical protein
MVRTSAAPTLIKLFVEMLKFWKGKKMHFSKAKIICE